MKGSRRRGGLSEEDLRLWAEVTRQVQPLAGRPAPTPENESKIPPGAAGAAPSQPKLGTLRDGRIGVQRPRPAAEASPPLAKLERRFVQRLRRGRAAPGAVIDLHGLTQDEARHRLVGFLLRCQAEGVKSAIVITGKGAPAATAPHGSERGVLRRAVPLWLAMPDFRSLVVGFEEAGAGLGGTGALILRLRASRRP
jgi:DNA-nicking Smr family endonuclease